MSSKGFLTKRKSSKIILTFVSLDLYEIEGGREIKDSTITNLNLTRFNLNIKSNTAIFLSKFNINNIHDVCWVNVYEKLSFESELFIKLWCFFSQCYMFSREKENVYDNIIFEKIYYHFQYLLRNLFHHRIYFSSYENIKSQLIVRKTLDRSITYTVTKMNETNNEYSSRMMYGFDYKSFLYEKLQYSSN